MDPSEEKFNRIFTAIGQLEETVRAIKSTLEAHQHSGDDGSSILSKPKIMITSSDSIIQGLTSSSATSIYVSNPIRTGNLGIIATSVDYGTGSAAENNTAIISVGIDKWLPEDTGIKSYNTELNIQDLPLSTTNPQSFIFANRAPTYRGTGVTFTAAATTFTDIKQQWSTNELTGGYVVVYNSSGAIVEARKISSNTATVATVSTAFGATTTNTYYAIMAPVYLGSADFPWRRAYVGDTNDGGIRFGYGKTADTTRQQTARLYKSGSDIIWEDPAGTTYLLDTIKSTSASVSTGVGTVKMQGATARDNVGWITFNTPGGGTGYFPYWTTITG